MVDTMTRKDRIKARKIEKQSKHILHVLTLFFEQKAYDEDTSGSLKEQLEQHCDLRKRQRAKKAKRKEA